MPSKNQSKQNKVQEESVLQNPSSTIQLDELAEIDIKVATLNARLERAKRTRNTFAIAFALFAITSGSVVAIFREDLFGSTYSTPNTGQIIAITLLVGIFLPFYLYGVLSSSISPLQREYEQLLSRRRVLASLSPKRFEQEGGAIETSYFEKLVQINVTNLAEYYTMVKVHTDNSFKASIGAGIIGFVLIVLGTIIGFTDNSSMKTIAYISSGAGIITEFIAGVFFYLYNSTVRQLKDYHDSLIDVQNVLLPFKIVGDLRDEKDRVKMVGEMLKFLIGNEVKKEST